MRGCGWVRQTLALVRFSGGFVAGRRAEWRFACRCDIERQNRVRLRKLLLSDAAFALKLGWEVQLAAGAEFIVLVCGNAMTMPGLPKVPSANAIDVNDEGKIVGLF